MIVTLLLSVQCRCSHRDATSSAYLFATPLCILSTSLLHPLTVTIDRVLHSNVYILHTLAVTVHWSFKIICNTATDSLTQNLEHQQHKPVIKLIEPSLNVTSILHETFCYVKCILESFFLNLFPWLKFILLSEVELCGIGWTTHSAALTVCIRLFSNDSQCCSKW